MTKLLSVGVLAAGLLGASAFTAKANCGPSWHHGHGYHHSHVVHHPVHARYHRPVHHHFPRHRTTTCSSVTVSQHNPWQGTTSTVSSTTCVTSGSHWHHRPAPVVHHVPVHRPAPVWHHPVVVHPPVCPPPRRSSGRASFSFSF